MGKSSCGETYSGKSSCGEKFSRKTLFHEKLFEGKVLRQNFLRKLIGKTSAPKTSIAEKFPGEKLLSGGNFHGETFIQKNFHRNFQSPTKTIRDRRKGNPSRKRKTLDGGLFLDNDDFEDTRDTPPDSIVQRKSPQRLRTLLRSRKTSSRKTYLPENFLVKAYFPENFFSAASITLLILV